MKKKKIKVKVVIWMEIDRNPKLNKFNIQRTELNEKKRVNGLKLLFFEEGLKLILVKHK